MEDEMMRKEIPESAYLKSLEEIRKMLDGWSDKLNIFYVDSINNLFTTSPKIPIVNYDRDSRYHFLNFANSSKAKPVYAILKSSKIDRQIILQLAFFNQGICYRFIEKIPVIKSRNKKSVKEQKPSRPSGFFGGL
ncbi:MAG: hypothetical protein KGH71_04115 [Candidatus Micrarchaeota archaeon]|nr:hypothetical protein [Candidatus Micrarchaeota archaeon]